MSLIRPTVSIGVPVYNTERYVAQALESMLAQTFPDFELLISDNASTDRTQEICEGFAARDPRVRYIRHPQNIGLPRNWNAVVHAASGEFFKWASASDYCAPTMIAHCVDALRADPEVVLCYGKTQFVDEDGQDIGLYDGDKAYEESRPSERFARICELLSLNNVQCGVVRLDALRKTRLDRLYPSGDMALTAELALYGRFKLLSEVLLYRRQSRATLTSMLTPLERQRVYDPQAKTAMKLIRTRWHMDNLASVARSPIPVPEKLRAIRYVLRFMRWERSTIWREVSSVFGG